MKCCVCKQEEATVHLTLIEGDKMQKVDLCNPCAEKTKASETSAGGLMRPTPSAPSEALRRKFVREAVLEVLRQCRGYFLPEATLMQQVNFTLAPAAVPSEIKTALKELRDKGRADWKADDDDIESRSWRISQ